MKLFQAKNLRRPRTNFFPPGSSLQLRKRPDLVFNELAPLPFHPILLPQSSCLQPIFSPFQTNCCPSFRFGLSWFCPGWPTWPTCLIGQDNKLANHILFLCGSRGHLHKSTQQITSCSCTVPLVVTYNRVHNTQQILRFIIFRPAPIHTKHTLWHKDKKLCSFIFLTSNHFYKFTHYTADHILF